MAIWYGNEVESGTRASQVYQATHRGDGKRLPFMNRSFISFTFGGKAIEDFNLIATMGDRLDRSGYAEFEDLTTTVDVGQGQYYWGTYYKTNSLSFTLSTDGMDQQQLDNFVWWFSAGETRELILSEHPNRAIMARVSTPPQISLLPFERKINIELGGATYKTSTTNYKGDISLEFIMDEPHWYSKKNIFGYQDDAGIFHDEWTDANGDTRSVFDDPDAIKIVYEDGIPISSMLQASMLLGDNTYASVSYDDNNVIAYMNETLNIEVDEHDIEDPNDDTYDITWEQVYDKGAVVGADDDDVSVYTNDEEVTITYPMRLICTVPTEDPDRNINVDTMTTLTEVWPVDRERQVGRIAGPKMTSDSSAITIGNDSNNKNLYFYYAGTAPSPITLSFTLTPQFSNNYICVPSNRFVSTTGGVPYNTITIESTTKQELHFTTPGIYTAYNAAIKIFETSNKLDWSTVADRLRESVYHSGVREWAMRILDALIKNKSGNELLQQYIPIALENMKFMFYDANGIMPATFTFNSKTGEAIGEFSYRKVVANSEIPVIGTGSSNWRNYSMNIIETKENVGDMLKSNYLIIRDRNYPKDGTIQQWEPLEKTNSHRLYHDLPLGSSLTNVRVEYKNMYL